MSCKNVLSSQKAKGQRRAEAFASALPFLVALAILLPAQANGVRPILPPDPYLRRRRPNASPAIPSPSIP